MTCSSMIIFHLKLINYQYVSFYINLIKIIKGYMVAYSVYGRYIFIVFFFIVFSQLRRRDKSIFEVQLFFEIL